MVVQKLKFHKDKTLLVRKTQSLKYRSRLKLKRKRIVITTYLVIGFLKLIGNVKLLQGWLYMYIIMYNEVIKRPKTVLSRNH